MASQDIAAVETSPGRLGGAKALLFTILGEFVLPQSGSAWTSSLVGACELLDINEKNARQALARVADQGVIESRRHGRLARWTLTAQGRRLLEEGAKRIYRFGTETVDWDDQWLVAHCPIPEAQRSLRHRLRSLLAFEGFGELAPSLAISPHVGREPALRRILDELGLTADSTVLRSRTGSITSDADLVARAWDVDGLALAYDEFSAAFRDRRPDSPEACFRSTVELVDTWRRFPFTDPELPTVLLPARWAGTTAAEVFHACRDAWSAPASSWFAAQEDAHRAST